MGRRSSLCRLLFLFLSRDLDLRDFRNRSRDVDLRALDFRELSRDLDLRVLDLERDFLEVFLDLDLRERCREFELFDFAVAGLVLLL